LGGGFRFFDVKEFLMKRLAILALTVALAGCGEAGDTGATAAPKQPDGPPVVVDAATISKAFQENEAKAQLIYGGKTIEITGTVKDITLDFSDKPVIALKGAGDQYGMGLSNDGKMTDVSLNDLPNEVAADITKGQKITAICSEIGEVMGGAGLRGCNLKP
jgi:hypothetical protein